MEASVKEIRISEYVLVIMKNLNLVIVLYMSLLMSYSMSGYVKGNSAQEFLSLAGSIPIPAWKLPLLVSCLYMCCLLLLNVQSENRLSLILKTCLETGISLFISYLLGFGYAGIMLLILADTLRYFPSLKWKSFFIAIICILYLAIDFDLLSIYYDDLIPFGSYLEYFQSSARSALLAIKNIASSVNTFVFFVYIVLQAKIQTSEKEHILVLNEQLNAANMELKRMTVELAQYVKESEKMVQTRERNRLAREIHDTLGHALTGIITGIEACVALMDAAPEATKIQLKAIAEVARQGITDVRRSVNALRPDALEKSDLESAITRTIDEMRTATNVQIDYQCTTRMDCFNDDEEEVIYRIVQESITNSIRHGKAEHIRIRIAREYNLLNISIRDDGTGCANIKKGFGLHHMEERLNMLGGSLSYDGTDGFSIEAQIPIRWGKAGMDYD